MVVGCRAKNNDLRALRKDGLCRFVLACSLGGSVAGASEPPFDALMLSQRGIDPQLAEYLRAAPRFAPGVQGVTLVVNGQPRGRHRTRFDQNGQPCFDADLLLAAGLVVPEQIASVQGPARCYDFVAAFPQTQVEPNVAALELGLVVPGDALLAAPRDLSGYTSGGLAGLLNYDLLMMQNQQARHSSRYVGLSTEVGFNAGDWIVRSRQIHTTLDGQSRTEHLEAFAQRTFTDYGTALQLGEINVSNPVLAGAQITGVQLMSEDALALPSEGAAIEGIAQSQARIEVRQAGVLIHSTLVPPGPFSLHNVRRLSQRADLEVRVIESEGAIHSFIVPAAMAGAELAVPGFALGVGQLRNFGVGDTPTVISAGWSQPLNGRSQLSSGTLLATDYRALGLGLGTSPWSQAQAQLYTLVSQAPRQGVNGAQVALNLSQRLSPQWAFNLGASHQTAGYRELFDTPQVFEATGAYAYLRNQYSGAMSWLSPGAGSFSLAYNRSALSNGSALSRGLASWNGSLGKVSLSATAEWDLGGRQGLGNALYLSASLPLGATRRVSSSVRRSAGEQRVGVALTEQVNQYLGYRVGAERDSYSDQADMSAGVSLLPRYAQLDLGYARYGRDSTSYNAGLRGGMALHEGGVTLSPYAIQDTFATLSVGDVAGVQVNTPSGPVWTDGRGQAVVPHLAAYGNSQVQVVAKSLPRNVDISNGAATLQAGRGSVAHVQFEVSSTRRVLLQVTDSSGSAWPKGASVMSEKGHFVTLVQEGGRVFLPNTLAASGFWIQSQGGGRCELRYALPQSPDLQAHYETASAVCEMAEEPSDV